MIWKSIQIVMDKRLSKNKLHDYLHGFIEYRGCGTGIMEIKLVQQLAYREQCPLYIMYGTVFLNSRKAYDTMDT